MEFLSLSWGQLHDMSYALAQKVETSPTKPDLIVAIARGGMTIAHMLSDFLSLPVATFTVSSYRNMKQEKISDVSYHVGAFLHDKKVLLVDDNADTGKTFTRGIAYLKKMGATSIQTASPLIKPWTKHVPDFYVEKTDRWIIFPYEVRETIEQITLQMKKENKSKEEITNTLLTFHLPKNLINTFLNI